MKRLLLPVLVALGCGGAPSGGGPGSGTQVLFEVPRAGAMPDLFSLPFPNDLRLKADGTLDLRGFPMGRRPDVLRGYLDVVADHTRGWATNAAAYVRFTSPIDPATLPADPAASTRPEASVFLMDVDPASPRMGTRVPVRLKYYETATVFVPERVLAILPLTGIPLRGKNRYAAVVTRRVLDVSGKPVAGAADFERVKGTAALADADLERARALYAPVFAQLEASGVARAEIAGLGVFTTQDPVGEVERVRAFVRTRLPEPEARDVACSEEREYVECVGRYDSPNFQRGVPPYTQEGGELVFDANGEPVVQRTENLRFVLTLPKRDPPAGGFPITLIAHGTGGSARSFLGANDTGDVLARRGIAAIGIDQPLHGERDEYCPTDPSAREQCESFWTFNLSNIRAARDNFRQGAIDDFQLVRLVRRLVIPAAIARLRADVRFDPAKIFFFGHSQGGITGPPFLAIEPDVAGAVLSGAGGSLAFGLLLKTKPTDIRSVVELLLGLEPEENEIDVFHPIITLVQTFVESADPLNYGPRIVAAPPPGGAPKHILVTEGLGDSYTPNAATEALAVAIGLNPVQPLLQAVEGLSLLGLGPLPSPVTGNAVGPGGARATAVLSQYRAHPDAATNDALDGHFVVYWNGVARAEYGDFLQSLAETGTATFTRR